MNRNKKYHPNKKYNPIIQAGQLEKVKTELERLNKVIDAVTASHSNHISYLGNFARHDIKNAIISMDSILTVTPPEDFNKETIESLTVYLGVIKKTIDNFAKLVPYSSTGSFKISSLFVAVELLTRSDMHKNKIKFDLLFNRNADENFELPFQSVLQMIINLLMNSIKALENIEDRQIILEGMTIDGKIKIYISDNGDDIKENNKNKIFKYGFSTTGGSGIGLFHALYLCENLSGNIILCEKIKENMTKTFCITLPLCYGKNGNNIG